MFPFECFFFRALTSDFLILRQPLCFRLRAIERLLVRALLGFFGASLRFG